MLELARARGARVAARLAQRAEVLEIPDLDLRRADARSGEDEATILADLDVEAERARRAAAVDGA